MFSLHYQFQPRTIESGVVFHLFKGKNSNLQMTPCIDMLTGYISKLYGNEREQRVKQIISNKERQFSFSFINNIYLC